MKKKLIKLIYIFFVINITNFAQSNSNFFEDAKDLFENEKYEESKFLLEKNIVYNPKHSKSYLYLAKIYKKKENDQEQKKNLDSTLLIDSKNEEALLMLMELNLKKSDFSTVNELMEKFSLICSALCSNKKKIEHAMENYKSKNKSDK